MTPPARVAVATSVDVPSLDNDGPMLLAALAAAGADCDVQVWDDPAVDWSAYDLVLVRSTWDYHWRREEFLSWVTSCPATSNPAAVLVWNTDKRYLRDLAGAVAVVPTVFLTEPGELGRLPADWVGDVVIKPAVSASAADTGRFPGSSERAAELVGRLHGERRLAMAQPYLPGIEKEGETSLVYLGGCLSHVVRRPPLLTGHGLVSVGGDHPRHYESVRATPAQVQVATDALRAVPGSGQDLTYARVDLIPGFEGEPLLSELELVEPGLFLSLAAASMVAVFASAVVEQAHVHRRQRERP